MTYEPVSLESLLSHQSWAMRLARRLVREEGDAEDLLQRTWIAALRHPPGSSRGARAWLRKVILNLARERYRREQTRARHEHAGAGENRSTPDAFELTSQKEICALLGQQLLGLQEPYRTVLVQRFYDGLSSAEISRRLGVPSGTVRWRLKIGLDQLREELDRRSQGDRSKWVSALLLFAPRDPASDAAEEAAELERGTASASSAAGLLPASAWLGVPAAVLLGGYFSFRMLADRSDAVRAASPPLAHLSTRDALPSGALAERVPLTGLPTPSGSLDAITQEGLAIRVVDEQDRPVPGARVFVAGARGFELRTTSDELGNARVAVHADDVEALNVPISRGRVGIRALTDGRATSRLQFVAPPFTGEQEVRLVIGGPETLYCGRVVDEHGRGIEGADVAWLDQQSRLDTRPEGDFSSAWYLSTRSDAEGRFRLLNVPPDDGSLLGSAPGHALAFVSTVDVLDPSEVVLRLGSGAPVSGRILRPDGRPAAGIDVRCEPLYRASERATGLPGYHASLRGFDEHARTAEDGSFRLAAVNAGARTLWALEPESGLVASETVTVVDGVEAHWDAVLGQRPTLRFTLVDQDRRPLAGWIAHLRRPSQDGRWWIRRTAADADGLVEILDCPGEEAFVDVFQPTGNGASFLSARVRPGVERVLEIDTHAVSSVEGMVLDGSGQPDTGGRLSFFALRTSLTTSVQRADDGSFSQRLAPGGYLLVLREEQAAVILARVVLGDGENRDLGTLTAPPMGTLRLDGAALQNGNTREPSYTVYAVLTERGEPRYFKADRGLLEAETLLSLFAGRYRLLCHDGSNSPAVEREIEVLPFAETRLRL